MIKVGIIGCGFMGGMHAACYKALESHGVRIHAMADTRMEFAERLAVQYGAKVFSSAKELIESDEVDVVDICLPVDLHVPHAVAAMMAGKHVFIEKPVCFLEEEMKLLLETEKSCRVKTQVGQVIRHWREYVWLKELVDSGKYGRVLWGHFKRLSAKPTWAGDGWVHQVKRSGGVAVEMHVHDVDYVRYLLGDPDYVQSQAARDEYGVIQHITSLYRYGEDVSIVVEAGWDFPQTFPFTAEFRVKLEKAAVVLEGGVPTVYPDEGEAYQPELPEAYVAENDIGGNISDLGGYYNELKYFVEGLQGQNDLTVAPIHEAVASVKLALREVEAAGGLIVE